MTIPDLITAFEASLADLAAKQTQLEATQADLKTRQIDADAQLGDSSIPFDTRVQEGVAIQLLLSDVKTQVAQRDALSAQVTRAAGEIRSLIRAELNTKKYARMHEISDQIEHDFVAIKLPLGPGAFAAQHQALLPWDTLSNGLSVATRPGDDWDAFLVNAKKALSAIAE
jgi:hypothetical protein